MTTKFIAFDGKKFDSMLDCKIYEYKVLKENVPVPRSIDDIEVSDFISLAESYMDDIISGKEIDTHLAYEELMKIVYDDNIFNYINKLTP